MKLVSRRCHGYRICRVHRTIGAIVAVLFKKMRDVSGTWSFSKKMQFVGGRKNSVTANSPKWRSFEALVTHFFTWRLLVRKNTNLLPRQLWHMQLPIHHSISTQQTVSTKNLQIGFVVRGSRSINCFPHDALSNLESEFSANQWTWDIPGWGRSWSAVLAWMMWRWIQMFKFDYAYWAHYNRFDL